MESPEVLVLVLDSAANHAPCVPVKVAWMMPAPVTSHDDQEGVARVTEEKHGEAKYDNGKRARKVELASADAVSGRPGEQSDETPGDASVPYLEKAKMYAGTSEYQGIKRMITSLRPAS